MDAFSFLSRTFLHSCPGNGTQSFFCSRKRKLLSALFSVCHRCSSRYTLLGEKKKKRDREKYTFSYVNGRIVRIDRHVHREVNTICSRSI